MLIICSNGSGRCHGGRGKPLPSERFGKFNGKRKGKEKKTNDRF